ncbi:4-(cytidine 5'-diphospho)-2-C-methyl-D-erythritol kinase [Jatrophihabitans sp. DSM 45814]
MDGTVSDEPSDKLGGDHVHVRVPAKINLHLGVGPLRPDGFHELTTVFQAVGLYDDITASAGTPGPAIGLSLSGPEAAGVPADERNLAWRAADLLAKHRRGSRAGVALSVSKAIPVAAGLAGGSADAAGALLACKELWKLDIDEAELDLLAAELGSDVTFALHGRTALGTGRGERLRPIDTPHEFHWVLAAASAGLSTPAVYRELDRQRAAGSERTTAATSAGEVAPLLAALVAGDYGALGELLINDLQPAALALAPQLSRTLKAGTEAGALAGLVSGSGPTCAFLAPNRIAAAAIATELKASATCRLAIPVVGNVHGARVLASP